MNVALFVPLGLGAVDATEGDRALAQDAMAKSLVRNAMTAIESANVDSRTFAVLPVALQSIEPSITFLRAGGHLVTINGDLVSENLALADNGQVEYFGDQMTYSMVTVSGTGTLWGVYVDKTGSGNWYLRSDGGETSVGW